MKSKRATSVVEKEQPVRKATSLFDRQNLLWMVIGAAVMTLGFLLMAGGRSEDPNVFNPDEVYSTTRITIAPLLIIFAIFRHPKNH